MAESIIETRGGWTSKSVTVGGKECTLIKGDNGIATFYWEFSGLSSSDTFLNLGTLPVGFRPITSYALIPLFSGTSPYATILGTLWISHGGAMTLYKSANVTGGYAYGIYLTGL